MPSMARLNLERTGSEIRDFYAVHQLVKDMPAVRRKLGSLVMDVGETRVGV